MIASLGTIWVYIGTPNLTDTGGTVPVGAPPISTEIEVLLGWVTWIGLALAIISATFLAMQLATRMRAGEGFLAVGKLGFILGGVVLMSAAAAVIAQVVRGGGPQGVGGAAFFIQSSLWWVLGAVAVLSVIVGGIRMAWEKRAEPGRDLVQSLITLIAVTAFGTAIIGILVSAADQFAVWVLNESTNCPTGVDTEGSACFGENITTLLQIATIPGGAAIGPILVIIFGLIAILVSFLQIVLMVARGGMLVVLVGILPVAASATNTEMGKNWFKKCTGWIIALVLYKPAAAIVYAAAFQLTGAEVNIFQDDGSGILAVTTGLMLMIIALFAMPALMRFVTPMVGSMAAGAGGGMLAAGALAALPSGAAALGRLSTGGGGGGNGNSGKSGEKGDSGSSSAPTGGKSGSQSASSSAHNAGAQSAVGGKSGAAASSGAASTGAATSGAGAATAGAGAGAGAGAAAGAGGGAVAGATAGAAGGPVGMAAGATAGVALGKAKEAGQAAAGAVKDLGEQSTGEGGGPDGSR